MLSEHLVIEGIEEFEPQGFHAGRLIALVDDFHDCRLVDVLPAVVCVFCHFATFVISCKVSVIPMSTGHWRLHLPHPLQLFMLNLPGK